MGVFDEISDIIKNLFGISGNGWVKRQNWSSLDIETCNGVATEDSTSRTCELCVALNGTIFRNDNKPEYYHYKCKCQNSSTSLTNIIVDFPISKITNYLFVNPNKLSMMKSMGYYIEDSNELHKTISNLAKFNFINNNYNLRALSIHGQSYQINVILNGKRYHKGKIFNCHIGCVAWPNGKIKIATPLIKD